MKRFSYLLLAGFCAFADDNKKKAPVPQSPLDRYVAEAEARSAETSLSTPGSTWIAGSRLADAARDVRASQVDDVLTIVVAEAASAVSTGSTQTSRATSTKNSVSALGGITRATGPLANLANVSGDTELKAPAPPRAPPR